LIITQYGLVKNIYSLEIPCSIPLIVGGRKSKFFPLEKGGARVMELNPSVLDYHLLSLPENSNYYFLAHGFISYHLSPFFLTIANQTSIIPNTYALTPVGWHNLPLLLLWVDCWWDAKYIGIPESYTTKVTSSTILLAVTPFKIAKYSPVT
jgi:hypothetical protein